MTSAAGQPVPRQLDQLIVTGQNEELHEEYEVVVTLKVKLKTQSDTARPDTVTVTVRLELDTFFLSDLLVLQTEI